MRSLTVFLTVFAIVAAGCTAAAPPTASPSAAPAFVDTASPSAAPAPVETAGPTTSTPARSLALTEVGARVTFDGAKCAYTGPTVIPFPANLTIDYAPTSAQDGSFVGIIAVHSGTTQADLTNPSNPRVGEGVPSFAYIDTHVFMEGPGSFAYRSASSGANPMAEAGPDGTPYDTYLVMCLPAIPGVPTGGQTILHVID
jgi:hypothetical protein